MRSDRKYKKESGDIFKESPRENGKREAQRGKKGDGARRKGGTDLRENRYKALRR